MSIRSIKLTNWMNIAEADLTFIDGINIIQGSVGEGKSSVFAAIAYALSDYKRGDTWKEYIRTGEKFFEIELYYQFGTDSTNLMKLYLKGELGKSSVYRELSYSGETKKGEEVTQFLNDKLDQQMLKAVIFNLQGGQLLSQMTPSESRDIFKKLFNSDFSSVVAQIKTDKETLSKEVTVKQQKIELLKSKEYQFYRIIPVDPQELIACQQELSNAQAIENTKLKLQQYNEKVRQIQKLEALLDNKALTITNQKAEIKKFESETLDIDSKLYKAKLEQEFYENRISEFKTQLAVLSTILKTYEVRAEEVNKWKESVKQYTSEVIECRSVISINNQYIETFKLGECPKCGQACTPEHSTEYADKIEIYTKKKVDAESQITWLNKNIEAYQLEDTNIRKDISAQELEITQAQNKAKEFSSQIVSLEQMKLRIMTSDILKCSRIIEATEREYSETSKDLDTEREWLVNNEKPVVVESGRTIQEIQKSIDDIQNRIQGNIHKEDSNERVRREKEADELQISTINDEVNDMMLQKDRLDKVNTIYSTDFPNFINMKACKILEGYMNKFFSTTKDKFEVALQMDKKGVSFYYKSNGEPDWRSLKMCSGYESALATLSFKVGVASAFQSSYIFLDEPEANASPEAAQSLFETISRISGFNQMFVITHKQEVIRTLLDSNRASGYTVSGGVFTELDY